MVQITMWKWLLDVLPHGYSLDEKDWQRRHRLLLWLLGLHVPALAIFGLAVGRGALTMGIVLAPPLICVLVGHASRHYRRTAAVIVTFGLVYCSTTLVAITGGTIEAHFHFFIIIGFIALYQDWAPFLFNILFVVISHGIGSLWQHTLIFGDSAGQANPWLWSLIHGIAVLFACVGMTLFWRFTEESQNEKDALSRRLAEAEIGRRQFTSDLLTNLARRNQSLLHRQLDIINQLEDSERDPDALAELFTLDHLATRVRRNAENLLVLSGEKPPRTWSEPVPLRDVLRAAIAETEDLDRVVFVVDERTAVAGHTVVDLTHLLAELTENAVRFSPPDTTVTLRARPRRTDQGGYVVTVEDWGIGMPAEDLAAANTLLATPPEVDLSVSQRLGFHVVARLAARHGVQVSLGPTPGSGITAVVVLPADLFVAATDPPVPAQHPRGDATAALRPVPAPRRPAAVTPPARDIRVPSFVGGGHGESGHGESGHGEPEIVTRRVRPGNQPTTHPAGQEGRWPGWWEHAAGPVPGPRPVAPGAPAAHSMSDSAPAGLFDAHEPPPPTAPPAPRSGRPAEEPSVGGLRRRVPQSHLAAELRVPAPIAAAAAPATAESASALSRYQASRARAIAEDGR